MTTRDRAVGVLATLLMVYGAGPVSAALILYEPFADATANGGTTYATGAAVTGLNSPAASIGQQNGPLVGNTGGAKWYAAGPTVASSVTLPTNTISSTNLSIPGLAASSGGSMQYGVSSGPSARLNLGSTYTSGTLYYSFALKVTDLGSLGTSGGFVAGFNNAASAQTTTPSVNSGVLMMRSVGSAATGNFNLGVRKGSGTPDWSPTVYSITDPNPIFVVGSYTFNAVNTTDDVARMWLNPDPSTFGGLTPANQLIQTGVADIALPGIASMVFWRRGNDAAIPPGNNSTLQPAIMFSDEIRVGTEWADVTPRTVPEAGAFVVWGLIGVVAFGMRKFWK